MSMDAPVSRDWVGAAHLVQPLKQSVCPVPTPDTEAPPPIPARLSGCECLYGYFVPNTFLEKYRKTHYPHHDLPDRHLRLAWDHKTISQVARSSGLEVDIEHLEGQDDDDIAWFSYTKGGVVKVKRVPTASKRFADELGITDEPQWHDAWLAVQVCVDIHPRPQPNNTEAPPPASLSGRVPLRLHRAEYAPGKNHKTISQVARSSGLELDIEHLEGHDDAAIAWFSYTKGGVVKVKQVSTALTLKRFADALGITYEPQWHDAWLAVQNHLDPGTVIPSTSIEGGVLTLDSRGTYKRAALGTGACQVIGRNRTSRLRVHRVEVEYREVSIFLDTNLEGHSTAADAMFDPLARLKHQVRTPGLNRVLAA
ncbi:hypothetical protein C8R44DRAFT_848843 [Mycena epipterygia]|nr:hypothetical protein C8R44DRAFT_848843 [Mycena epipterygia]